MKLRTREGGSLSENKSGDYLHADNNRHLTKWIFMLLLVLIWPTDIGASVVLEQEPEKDQAQVAAENLDKIAEETQTKLPQEISRQSLVDIVAKAKGMNEQGEIDLSKSIEVEISADRDSDGKLRNVVLIQKKNDPKVLELAKDSIDLVSTSGVLSFLEGVERLRLNVKLSKSSFDIDASADVESAERAEQMAKGYNLMLMAGSFIKRGLEEETLYKSTKVSSKKQQLTLNFSVPSATLGDMLLKLLPPTENSK